VIAIQDLLEAYQRNLDIITLQSKDLSQQDSLRQLPFRSNCLNWVVGHILTNRCTILRLMGLHDILPGVDLERYQRESDPITGPGKGVLTLAELINHLATTQQLLAQALENETQDTLQRLASFPGSSERPLAYWLFFFFFHDCYHVGQTEILRQAAGADDKII